MGAAVLQRATRRESLKFVIETDSTNAQHSNCSAGLIQYVYLTGADADGGSEVVAFFRQVVHDRLEDIAFSSLSESSFAQDWDSEADAVYDDI